MSLYTSSNPRIPPDLQSLFPPIINYDDNSFLRAIPHHLEIQQAVSSLGTIKAPRLDGMSCIFYRKNWDTVGDDVVTAIQSFFRGNHTLKHFNQTFITLATKNESSATTHNYHPISLCNVSYKIISKILATRLRSILHKIISPLQAAFILGRCIQDNSIIAHEIMHFLIPL